MEYMLIQGLFLRQFHLSFLFILFSLTLNTHAAVPGVTAGEFSVDASGGANYSIPIAVPPGTSGMQPSLSLSYSSRSGNGMLGVGFTLGGLSVMTRCPANKVIDGFIDGVDFDDNDRFCIDGQRLIAVTGTYGSNGTEYRTELDGFTKVLSYGTTGNGPQKFLAYTKSGQILEYGYTTDSQIEAEGKTDIRLWAVNKISDTVGNYLTITYAEDNTNGTYKPTRIDYTGNSGAGVSPYAKVEFEYETRTDIQPLYFAGSLIKNTERITNIKMYVDNTLVRDYQLTYDNAGAANRSRLIQLTECDGEATPTCFKPIEFDRVDGGNDTFNPRIANPLGANFVGYTRSLEDMNGDGITDLVYVYNTSVSTYMGIGDGTFGPRIANPLSANFSSYSRFLADMNGDGITDLVYVYSTSVSTYMGIGDGTFGPRIANPLSANFSSYSRFLADMNGDGITDLVYVYNTSVSTYMGIGDGTFGPRIANPLSLNFNTHARYIFDVNSDGISDLVYLHGTVLTTLLGIGDGTFDSQASTHLFGVNYNSYSYTPIFTDINGDGLIDLCWIHNKILNIYIRQGDGTFVEQYHVHGGNYISYSRHLADMNGDGIIDLVYIYNTYVSMLMGNGDGSFGSPIGFSLGANFSSYSRSLSDMNGDGITDLAFIYDTSESTYLSKRVIPDSIIKITTSLGTQTDITYTPITDPSVYTKGTGATYPVIDIQGPVYVVSSVKSDSDYVANGSLIPSQRETTYTYSGAKSSYLRGFLGFNTMSSTDVDTGMTATTTYKQSHPYTGMVERTEQHYDNGTPADTSDDVLLGEVDTTFNFTQTHTGTETDASHPGVLFPYAATVTKKEYEID